MIIFQIKAKVLIRAVTSMQGRSLVVLFVAHEDDVKVLALLIQLILVGHTSTYNELVKIVKLHFSNTGATDNSHQL